VKGCQNRRYKIIYGDDKRHKISELLKGHRQPLTYIDKFAPNLHLLAKLPVQLRSKEKGIHFDEEKLAKFIEENEKGTKNEKRKEKGNRINFCHLVSI